MNDSHSNDTKVRVFSVMVQPMTLLATISPITRRRRLLDQVLVQGHPLLAQTSTAVTRAMLGQDAFRRDCQRLCETLLAFRAEHGFGRAVAAPQVGINRRMIALNLPACANYETLYHHSLSCPEDNAGDDEAARSVSDSWQLPGDCIILLNPQMTYCSTATRTVWDDCLSLPNMMVRVQRHESIGVDWMDHYGVQHTWKSTDMEFDLAELLQHEMDHLNGILATDRVQEVDHPDDRRHYPAIITRDEFEANKKFYQSYVDYTI